MTYRHRTGVHPREKFAQYADIIPEGAFDAWEQQGLCLCGCGEKPKATHAYRPEVINYWAGGHFATLRRLHGRFKGPPRTQTQRNAARAHNRSLCIGDGKVILEMVQQVIDTEFDGNISRFCRERLGDGTTHSSLAYNLNRGVTRLTKRRAAMLLRAVGETPHPSLEKP